MPQQEPPSPDSASEAETCAPPTAGALMRATRSVVEFSSFIGAALAAIVRFWWPWRPEDPAAVLEPEPPLPDLAAPTTEPSEDAATPKAPPGQVDQAQGRAPAARSD